MMFKKPSLLPCVTLTYSSVPKYLHQSQLYKNLSDSIDDHLSIPSSCFKTDLVINGAPDLETLLLTLRFWVLPAFPDELITFLLKPLGRNVKKVLKKFNDHTFPSLGILDKIRCQPRRQACNIAAQNGDLALLDYFARNGVSINWYTLRVAAQNDHIDCLTYVHNALQKKKRPFPYGTFAYSLNRINGSVACVKFLVEHGMIIGLSMLVFAADFGLIYTLKYMLGVTNIRHELISYMAADSGNLACLQCAVEHGCVVMQRTWTTAVKFPDCLQYLLHFHATPKISVSVHLPDIPCVPLAEVLTPELSLEACRRGEVTSLCLLQAYNCPLHVDMVNAAAGAGSMTCLYVLAELGFDCYVPSTMAAAAGAGQLELVKELNALGCPWDDSAPVAALLERKVDCLEYLINERNVPSSDTFAWLLEQSGAECIKVVIARKQRGEDQAISESFWAEVMQENEDDNTPGAQG